MPALDTYLTQATSLVLGLTGLALALAGSAYMLAVSWPDTTWADLPKINTRNRRAAAVTIAGVALQAFALVVAYVAR